MDIFAWNNTAASRQLMPNGTAVCHGNGPFTGGTIFRRQSNRRNTRFYADNNPVICNRCNLYVAAFESDFRICAGRTHFIGQLLAVSATDGDFILFRNNAIQLGR